MELIQFLFLHLLKTLLQFIEKGDDSFPHLGLEIEVLGLIESRPALAQLDQLLVNLCQEVGSSSL